MTMAATITATIILITPADLEADRPARQYRADRHAQQHDPDRGHRVVLLPVHGTKGEGVGTRRVRLADDAAGTGLVGLELRLLSWLVPEMTESDDEQKLVLPLLTDYRVGARECQSRQG